MNGEGDPPRRARRRAVRPAGTVGGNEGVLRSSLPVWIGDAGPGAGESSAIPDPAPADRLAVGAASTPTGSRPERAPDDLDVGWGETLDDSNDGRLERDRPPHW